jgi:two-component system, OmpR family, sensor histidine kinase QseC
MRLLRPTLTRRVVLALLAAFLLTWIVLLLFQYVEVRFIEKRNPELTQACAQLQDALHSVSDPQQAMNIGAAVERMSTGGRQRMQIPDKLLIQIWDLQEQRVVYTSPLLSTEHLAGDPAHQTRQVVHGQLFEVAQRDSARWSVRVAQSHVEGFWLLMTLAGDLIKYMLIALPFILVPVWIATSRGLRPLRELSGRIAGRSDDDLSAVGTVPKYTELKPFVAALDGLFSKLAGKIQRERAFVQDAAHELRTPMAVISAQAHALKNAPNAADREEANQYLDSAIARASHLIHQLLTLARLNEGRPSQMETVDLAQLVRQELASLSKSVSVRRMELTMEGPDRLSVPIEVPPFQSVLHNLVDNAIRYGRDGGRIQVELQGSGAGWSLAVSDDGPGIQASDQPHVFDRFYRGTGHDAPGTGLGLAIVAQAVARLGGQVNLTTGLDGRGCRFAIIVATPIAGQK